MKTNAKQIESIANLATPKPFDAIQTAHFLGVEIVGFNNASDKLVGLQKQIDDTKVEKGTRKKAIDALLKELWQNNATMIESGKGKQSCPIRVELKRVLDTSNLADTTKNNIVTAVAFALKHKKPYDIHAPTKYNAMLKAEKEKEKLKNEIIKGGKELKNAIPPTTPVATTPVATTPAATTPAATTPTTKVNAPKVEPEKASQYCKSMATLMESVFSLTEPRRMLNDEHEKTYDDIIIYMNEIMDLVSSLK
jgi:hypothetical protein